MSDVQGTPMGRQRLLAEAVEKGLELDPEVEEAPDPVEADDREPWPIAIPVMTNAQVALLASTIGNSKRNVRADEVEAWAEAALEWLDAKDAERAGDNS